MSAFNRYFLTLTCTWLLCQSPVLAQFSANFTLNSNIGCAPFTVEAYDLSGVPDSVVVTYRWGDGSLPLDNPDSVHVFTRSGTYMIVQTVQNANPRTDTAFVTVVDAPQPQFNVLQCKSGEIRLRITDQAYPQYFVEFGDGNTGTFPAGISIAHTYAALGTYTLSVQGLINDAQQASDSSNYNCAVSQRTISLQNTLIPADFTTIEVVNTSASNGTIQMGYSLNANNNYYLEYRANQSGPYTIMDTLDIPAEASGIALQGLNTQDNFYCFRLVAFDPCDGSTMPSGEACSVLPSGEALNGFNRISWQTASADYNQVEITKNSQNWQTIANPAQTSIDDNDVACNASYCYRIRLRENSGFTSISDTVCVTAFSNLTLPAIDNITATIVDDAVQLQWPMPAFSPNEYFISRRTGNGSYLPLDTINDNMYVDVGAYINSRRHYYRIGYEDDCGNSSATSVIASPVLLTQHFDESISWSRYMGWALGVGEYILERYRDDGSLIDRISMGNDTTYAEDAASDHPQVVVYRVVAVPNDAAFSNAYSNDLRVIYRSRVFFPNAFTPDGDGLNDIFNFESRFIQSCTLRIYSRWGELLYLTEQLDVGWDGTLGGTYAPVGTYVYQAELIDDMGVSFTKTGEVVLIR